MKDLKGSIEFYHKNREANIDIVEYESYKWIAFKHFKDNYNKKYNSINEWICEVYAESKNLLASYRYLPYEMLKEFASKNGMPDRLQIQFEKLLQRDVLPTPERVREFIDGAKSIMRAMADSGYSDWKGRKNLQTYQDVHAVSVYLSMFYPNDFYIYKYSIFEDFAKQIDYTIVNTNAIERLFEYQKLCDIVKVEIKKNKELIADYKKWLRKYHYEDDNLNLLTQDFIYAIVKHLNYTIKGCEVRNFKQITADDLKFFQSPKHRTFKGVKGVDYIKINRENHKKGTEGELWALSFETQRLEKQHIDTNLVKHIVEDKGDGCGYDIQSVEDDGVTPRYIEVKTTTGNMSQPIRFTANELAYSIEHKEHYYVYRVYNFKARNKPADLAIIENVSLDELNEAPKLFETKIYHENL